MTIPKKAATRITITTIIQNITSNMNDMASGNVRAPASNPAAMMMQIPRNTDPNNPFIISLPQSYIEQLDSIFNCFWMQPAKHAFNPAGGMTFLFTKIPNGANIRHESNSTRLKWKKIKEQRNQEMLHRHDDIRGQEGDKGYGEREEVSQEVLPVQEIGGR